MKNKGITLLALIVTVIIMVILASVSINLITNGGIIDKTRTTTKEYQYQADKEQFELAKIGATDYLTDEVDEEKMEIALESWTHEGKVWTSPNGNEFTIDGTSSGGKEEEPEEAPDLLKQYILGEELTGRNIMEIAIWGDDGVDGFIDEETTISGASTEIEYIGLYPIDALDTNYIIMIKYNSKYYKFQINTDEMNTIAEYGVVEFYKEDSTSKVGKKVNYDGENWIIIYDDKTNGIQMVSENILEYNGEEFKLGYNDSYLTKHGELEGTTDIEKSIYSYNKVVDTLNKACTEIVNTTPSYIKDVRCVGSNPINKNSESSEKNKSDFLVNHPTGDEGKYYDVGKDTDMNFVSDYERLAIVGATKAPKNGTLREEDEKLYGYSYWLASRLVEVYSDEEVYFRVRYVYGDGYCDGDHLWNVIESYANDSCSSNGLRPVVSLNSNICNLTWDEGNGYFTISNK